MSNTESRYNKTARFWLDDKEYKELSTKYHLKPDLNLNEIVEKTAILKTISNFVNIVTNENIPVKFEGQSAHSDGKEITISANVKDFDLVCGLSLHESSHVKYSQPLFDILKNVNNEAIVVINGGRTDNIIVHKVVKLLHSWKKDVNFENFNKTMGYVHTIINIIEDFRIDTISINNFPGYKGYYDALVAEYLICNKVTKELKTNPELSEESYFSYKMNLSAYLGGHPSNNLLKLNGGQEIIDTIDPSTIANKSALDILTISFKVVEIIAKHVKEAKEDKKQTSQSKQTGKNKDKEKSEKQEKSEESEKQEKSEQSEKQEKSEKPKTQENGEHGESDETSNEPGSMNKNDDLDEDEDENTGENNSTGNKTDDNEDEDETEDNESASSKSSNTNENLNELDELDKDAKESNSTAFKTLTDAINGNYKKSKLTSAEANAFNLFSNKMFKIKKTVVKNPLNGVKHNVNVIIINKLDEEVLKYVPNLCTLKNYTLIKNENAVNKGINLGRALGSKLQVMNDTHINKSIRRKNGNIESRLLSEIGTGNVKIFSRKTLTQYEKQFVHISIDSSGSMDGLRFRNSLQMAANIASAATFVNGMRVQVSVRSTTSINVNGKGKVKSTAKSVPFVAIIYDSKFDNINHIRNWWPRLTCPGVTPEAICFDAIKDIIFESSKDKNSYFVNISDGAPCYNGDGMNYNPFAAEHTVEVMKDFKRSGLKIISYFIDGDKNHADFFIKMYGNDAAFIDTSNINDISKTLNKKFLGA